MTTTEKLNQVVENERKALELNKKLENALYGTEFGGKSHYDTFWDSAKDKYGEISGFLMYAFAGAMWSDTTFNPPCNIKPTYGAYLFAQSKITDLKGILERNNVALDVSTATNVSGIIEGSAITRLPIIDTRNITALTNFLYNGSQLVSVDKVILKDDGSQTTTALSFKLLPSLVEIRFEGVIGANVDISSSIKLSAQSYNSIMTHLSTTSSGKTLTLPNYETVKSTYDAKYGNNAWDTIVANKSNWTIAYN